MNIDTDSEATCTVHIVRAFLKFTFKLRLKYYSKKSEENRLDFTNNLITNTEIPRTCSQIVIHADDGEAA